MKTSLLFLFVFLFNFLPAFGQDEISVKVSGDSDYYVPDGVYIIDSSALYHKMAIFPVDIKNCFFQLSGDYAVLFYEFRGRQRFFSGPVSHKKVVTIDGKRVSAFTVVTDNKFATSVAGKREFIGYAIENGKPVIYELDVHGVPDRILKAHNASEKEIKALKSN